MSHEISGHVWGAWYTTQLIWYREGTFTSSWIACPESCRNRWGWSTARRGTSHRVWRSWIPSSRPTSSRVIRRATISTRRKSKRRITSIIIHCIYLDVEYSQTLLLEHRCGYFTWEKYWTLEPFCTFPYWRCMGTMVWMYYECAADIVPLRLYGLLLVQIYSWLI